MVDQNELRIGNWVLDKGKPVQVDGLQFSGRIVVFDEEYDYQKRGIEPDPIPLTPEILEKAGFSNKPNSSHQMFWHIDDLTFRWREQTGLHFIYREDGARQVTITTLHHLQNIVFDLTGEELKIEL